MGMTMQKTTDDTWRLTAVIRDHDKLAKLARAGYRATLCSYDGMHRRIIVAMLNKWFPGLAISPDGAWDNSSMLLLVNATRSALNDGYVYPDGDEPSWHQGQRIVRWQFRICAELKPDDMRAINALLMREATEEATRGEVASRVAELTGVPCSA